MPFPRKQTTLLCASALIAVACGPANNGDGGSNNGSTAASNNGAETNNGQASNNGESSNNGTTATSNNGTASNNGTSTNNETSGSNNGTDTFAEFRAVAVSSDFAADSSSWLSLGIDEQGAFGDETQMAASDVGVSAGERWVYVVDRTFGMLWVVDPQNDLELHSEVGLGGFGANPYAAIDAGGKTFVSLYDTGQIGVADSIDIGTDAFDRAIALDAFDTDSNPEPGSMVFDGDNTLVVALQTLVNFTAESDSQLAVIDVQAETATATILTGVKNLQAGMQWVGDDLAVGWTGAFGAMDGGIGIVGRTGPGEFDGTVETVVTEEELGGDLLSFVMTSATSGVAVISLADFSSKALKFEVGQTTTIEELTDIESPGFGGIAYDEARNLWAIGDRGATPGFTIFDLSNDESVEWSSQFSPAGLVFVP